MVSLPKDVCRQFSIRWSLAVLGFAWIGIAGPVHAQLSNFTDPLGGKVKPVDGAKPHQRPILAGRPDPALAASSLARPGPSQGGMQGELHLILDVEVRPRQEAQQVVDVRGDVVPEVRLDQGAPEIGRASCRERV